jgi:alkaline phosphatase
MQQFMGCIGIDPLSQWMFHRTLAKSTHHPVAIGLRLVRYGSYSDRVFRAIRRGDRLTRHHEPTLTRRQWLGRSGALALGMGMLTPRINADDHAPITPTPHGRVPRNILFFVSDGMSGGVPALAEAFSRQVRGRGTIWQRLAREPHVVKGLLATASLSSMVTDSAAAASAWGSGSKVFNGAINMLPDGRELVPIGRLLKDSGRRVALVTTTKITHATPAGFAAVQAFRDDEHEIAPQYNGIVDIALGGGQKFYDPKRRKDGRDIYAQYREAGYAVCTTRRELLNAATASERVLGCFYDDHEPYAVDHMHSEALRREVPTLAEMTGSALAMLKRADTPFFMMVEGGRVDHAAHANDAFGILWDQLAFDDAVNVGLEFAAQREDTLVIITTDHGNSNPGLNGIGTRYNDSTDHFMRIAEGTASLEDGVYPHLRRLSRTDGLYNPADVHDVIRTHTGVDLTAHEADVVANVLSGQPNTDLNHQHRGIFGALGQALGNHVGIGWTGITHTNDDGLLMALGPGSERFGVLMPHTQVNAILRDFWDLEHVNPSMSDIEARKFAARRAEDVEILPVGI